MTPHLAALTWQTGRALVVSPIGLVAFVILLSLTGCSRDSGEQSALAGEKPIKKRVAAPELVGGSGWLNTAKPLALADLKGRVVLLDFWTLCCINCIHTLPDLAKLEKKYEKELVVIGVHSPKFKNEQSTESVRKAILRYDVRHPVVNDANRKIWEAYSVES